MKKARSCSNFLHKRRKKIGMGFLLQMPGFPVFGTGQPTLPGFDKILEPIMKKYGDEKIIYWANLRQEPVVYVNGKPYTARDPAK